MDSHALPTSRDEAEAFDRKDPFRETRQNFILPDNQIYLVGHSLGPSTHSALNRLKKTAEEEWKTGLVGSWNSANWIDLPMTVGAKIARLIGTDPQDVILTDSVSVNLFKLAAAALPVAKGEPTILYEGDEFPTDQYIAQGLSAMTGVQAERLQSGEGQERIKRGGVLIKSAVNFRTAQVADIAGHEKAAAENGGIIVWDLSHATGVIALDLAAQGAKLATGCTYKYLNGGPGAPAFVYAKQDFAARLQTPLSGWFGHKAPFAFESDYSPKNGVARFAVGTPPILSLSALNGALDTFEGVDLTSLQNKTQRLIRLCNAMAKTLGLPSLSPPIGELSGGHVSLIHENAYPIVQALIFEGIKLDFRAPTTVRFGFSPLFIRYVDVWDAMTTLGEIIDSKRWDQPRFKIRSKVT